METPTYALIEMETGSVICLFESFWPIALVVVSSVAIQVAIVIGLSRSLARVSGEARDHRFETDVAVRDVRHRVVKLELERQI